MLRLYIVLLTFVYASSLKAEVFRHVEVPEKTLSYKERAKIKEIMSCQIKENFQAYAEHIINQIIPRVSRELPVLLRPHISVEGKRVQVAEAIDAADLFHVHVRMPLAPLKYHPLPFSVYLDPEIYHLQYHSYEWMGLVQDKWRSELSEIKNPMLQKWLADVEEHIYLQSLQRDPGLGDYDHGSLLFKSPIQESLSEEQIDRFSSLWYEHRNSGIRHSDEYKEWLIDRLKMRLKYIDPKEIGFRESIRESRSLVSTINDYLILDGSNIPDHGQFANIYFEDRSDMTKKLNGLLKSIEDSGVKYLVKGGAHFDEVVSAISENPDDLNALKYAYSNDTHAALHRVIGWTDNHVFSVSFSLVCPDDSDKETVTN